jgi:hypothetical protein
LGSVHLSVAVVGVISWKYIRSPFTVSGTLTE